jgi:hypothetical protein
MRPTVEAGIEAEFMGWTEIAKVNLHLLARRHAAP